MRVNNGDVVTLRTGEIVMITDAAEYPETLFCYTSVDQDDGPPFYVTDTSEVVQKWTKIIGG